VQTCALPISQVHTQMQVAGEPGEHLLAHRDAVLQLPPVQQGGTLGEASLRGRDGHRAAHHLGAEARGDAVDGMAFGHGGRPPERWERAAPSYGGAGAGSGSRSLCSPFPCDRLRVIEHTFRSIGRTHPMDPFYRRIDEDRFESTPATAGPWSPDAQHAGPPSALLARAMELHEPREGTRLADVRTDILGPIPIQPLTVSVRTLRGGRSMELLEAQAATDDGRPALIARAWRIRRAPEDFPPLAETLDVAVDGPPEATTRIESLIPGASGAGYSQAVEWRFVEGGVGKGGESRVWGRQLTPLVDDEEPTPWQRVVVLADSGGGVTFSLDPARH